MFALKDADFADIIGQYLANLANTGLALSGDQVFPWVLEYYAKDDEKEIAEKDHDAAKSAGQRQQRSHQDQIPDLWYQR